MKLLHNTTPKFPGLETQRSGRGTRRLAAVAFAGSVILTGCGTEHEANVGATTRQTITAEHGDTLGKVDASSKATADAEQLMSSVKNCKFDQDPAKNQANFTT